MQRQFTDAARIPAFWAKVARTEFCWEWQGKLHRQSGYGRVKMNGREEYAHRVSWWLACGDIPDGMELDHLCRNKRCVRPEHLQPVSHLENTLRGDNFIAIEKRATHCKHGHEFTPENTRIHYWGTKTMRACRECSRLRWYRDPRRKATNGGI